MFSGLKFYAMIGAGALLLAALGWGLRVDHLRGAWKGKFETLTGEAQGVVEALRHASGNDKVTWDTAAGQAIALGEENRGLRAAITVQNESINQMAREAVRLRAEAVELKRIADRAQAQRAAALRRLSDLSITPGTRDDCMQLLREAEEALDLVYEAGL